ncbi:MAG: hypothetical protein EA420_13220 [Candidatus Competibacteraceae bacterium]|nr:MAG: hypothetical protein EA420_13220 [Candidatus Competibacteraceae bacterium]
MPDYCPYSGKIIYPRASDGWRVVRAQKRLEWRKTHKTPPPEIRPYRCEFCGQFHLGTYSPKPTPHRRVKFFDWIDEGLEQ